MWVFFRRTQICPYIKTPVYTWTIYLHFIHIGIPLINFTNDIPFTKIPIKYIVNYTRCMGRSYGFIPICIPIWVLITFCIAIPWCNTTHILSTTPEPGPHLNRPHSQCCCKYWGKLNCLPTTMGTWQSLPLTTVPTDFRHFPRRMALIRFLNRVRVQNKVNMSPPCANHFEM